MSKELYDLCRRYKHFYNKKKDVLSWHHKYHDIDLSDAIKACDIDLKKTEDFLLSEIFNKIGVHIVDMKVNYEYEEPMMSFGRRFASGGIRRCIGTDAEINVRNSQRFVDALVKHHESERRGIIHGFGRMY